MSSLKRWMQDLDFLTPNWRTEYALKEDDFAPTITLYLMKDVNPSDTEIYIDKAGQYDGDGRLITTFRPYIAKPEKAGFLFRFNISEGTENEQLNVGYIDVDYSTPSSEGVKVTLNKAIGQFHTYWEELHPKNRILLLNSAGLMSLDEPTLSKANQWIKATVKIPQTTKEVEIITLCLRHSNLGFWGAIFTINNLTVSGKFVKYVRNIPGGPKWAFDSFTSPKEIEVGIHTLKFTCRYNNPTAFRAYAYVDDLQVGGVSGDAGPFPQDVFLDVGVPAIGKNLFNNFDMETKLDILEYGEIM
jgi:hypothetical protein